jgi:hypothetical protein
MKDEHLFRVLGGAAILGGVLRIGSSFIPWDGSAQIEALAFVIDVSLLFGLMGIYLAARERLGWFGLVAFVLAETGIASIIGPDTTSFGIDTYQAGVVVISVGLALLGFAMLLARAGFTLSALCWIASLIVGVAGGFVGQGAAGFLVGGILFGLGFVAAGLRLVSPGYRVE